MERYEVTITPDAAADLTELRDYIAGALFSPDAARSCIRSIRLEIEKLESLPAIHPLVEEEPWHSRGVRSMLVKNFLIYYRVDEPANHVDILNVIYARRDQWRILRNRENR